MRLKSLKQNIENNIFEFEKVVAKSKSISDLLNYYNFCDNGKQRKYFRDIIEINNINTNHFYDIKILTNCGFCNKEIKVFPRIINNSKCKKAFCGQSCSATYNNTHKKFGIRISKLEKWLSQKLVQLYPNLEFHFNRKDAINAELDIYIPSLNLAFELNGIFHYEPIFGEEKLKLTQNNDKRKFQACLEKQIELCIIDVSKQKYFKKKHSEEYLNIITSLINAKVADK